MNEKPGVSSLGGAGSTSMSYSANKYSANGVTKPPTSTSGISN